MAAKAHQRPFGDVEDRVRTLSHEKALLECDAKPSVDFGVPFEMFFRNVAETHRPEADELVLT